MKLQPRKPFPWKHIIKAELIFLIWIVFNTLKLTGTQYLMTHTSGFPLWKMALRNIFFLYFSWRVIFLFRKRVVSLAVYLLQTLFMAVLLMVFLYSGEIIVLSQIFTIKEGIQAAGTLKVVVLNWRNIFLILDLPVFIYVFRKYVPIRTQLKAFSIPLLLLSGIGLYALLWKLDYFKGTGTEWGILGRQAKYGTLYTSLVLSNTSNQKDAVKSITYGREITIPEKETKHNIITIQTESLTSDVLNLKVAGRLVMPLLSKIASHNVYFPYMLIQHKTGASSDAEFSMVNGVEAIRGFPACQLTTYDYPNSFIKRLPDNVHTAAFHANTGSYFNRNFNLPAMGFDIFFDIFKMGLKEKKWGGSDEDLLNFAIGELKKEKSPYYYHIITMTSHGPFNLVYSVKHKEPFSSLPKSEEKDYLTSMAYVDSVLGKAVQRIRSLDKNAYIFIYGDHSIRLSGKHYRGSSYIFYDSRKFEFTPLIIITPEGTRYRETKRVASILDLGATILDASGYGGTIRSFGGSLLRADTLPEKIINDSKEYSRKKLFRLVQER